MIQRTFHERLGLPMPDHRWRFIEGTDVAVTYRKPPVKVEMTLFISESRELWICLEISTLIYSPSDVAIHETKRDFLGEGSRAVEILRPDGNRGKRTIWSCINADPLPDFGKFRPAAPKKTVLEFEDFEPTPGASPEAENTDTEA